MARNTTGARVKAGMFSVALGVAGLACVLTALSPAALAVASSDVQGYPAKGALDPGTVAEKSGDGAAAQSQVSAASKDRLNKMFGVVVDRSRLSVILSGGDENEVYVATAGTHPALVGTENGPITAGDYLTLSSIDGVLMKADTRQQTIFGRAVEGFTDTSVSVGTMTLKDDQGKTHSVRLGLVATTIDIKKNPNKESTKSKMPPFLEDIGQQIAKKDVSPVRIYLSLFITAVSLITAFIILYSGVKSGIISIGRNPMSKRSIFRALLEIILTSIAVLMVGLFAVYLLLRL